MAIGEEKTLTGEPLKITGRAFAQALQKAGVIADLNGVHRIVIVADATGPLIMHVERLGDERTLDVAALLAGTETE